MVYYRAMSLAPHWGYFIEVFLETFHYYILRVPLDFTKLKRAMFLSAEFLSDRILLS